MQEQRFGRSPGMVEVQKMQEQRFGRPPGVVEVRKMHDSMDGEGRTTQETKSRSSFSARPSMDIGVLWHPCHRAIPSIHGHRRSLASMPSRHTVHPWTSALFGIHATAPYRPSMDIGALWHPCHRAIPSIHGHRRSLASMPPRHTVHPWT